MKLSTTKNIYLDELLFISKSIKSFLFVLLFSLAYLCQGQSTTCTFLGNNSSWLIAANWSCGRLPQAGDYIIIPVGKTVNIDVQVNLDPGPPTFIESSGTINFTQSVKLMLSAGSGVETTGTGCLTGILNNTSQKIMIDGIEAWASKCNGGHTSPECGITCIHNMIWGSDPTLPIELTKFSAASENKGVRVNWITSANDNSTSFNLEKSYDGKKFNKISTINSTSEHSYSYLDENEKNSLVYYRLKTINSSGLTEASNVISLNQEAYNKIDIYPNPCRRQDQMSIKINSSIEGNCSILITNSQGGIIYKNQFLSNEISLPEFSLTPGIYFIQVASETERVTEKFIIE